MRIGFDYGGTKIAGIALGDGGETLAEGRVPTPRHDYRGGIAAIHGLMRDLERQAGRKAAQAGIGVPGSVDRDTGVVSGGNSTWLWDQNLKGDLADALGVPVRVANDANCFALSEAVDGAGKGAQVVFGVILGSGVGGGIVVRGQLIEGINAIAGEWGHVHLPAPQDDERPGPACSCRVPGHTESWLSGRSLSADYARRTGLAEDQAPPAEAIIARAAAGEAAAEDTLCRYEDRLGRSLAMVVNILDPDVIVLGGGMSNVARLYRTVPPILRSHTFGGAARTRLAQNVHGDASGVRGAAWL
jgi:fructokinase